MFSAILKLFGLSSGGFYAIAGVLVVICGLGGVVYVQSLRLDASRERVKSLEKDAAELKDALQQSEDDKARLLEKQHLLDAALAERQKRLIELEVTKRKIAEELDALKQTLPKEDQDCLNRPLPDALFERLRVGDSSDKDGEGAGP